MLSAICFNLDKSKILSSGTELIKVKKKDHVLHLYIYISPDIILDLSYFKEAADDN